MPNSLHIATKQCIRGLCLFTVSALCARDPTPKAQTTKMLPDTPPGWNFKIKINKIRFSFKKCEQNEIVSDNTKSAFLF